MNSKTGRLALEQNMKFVKENLGFSPHPKLSLTYPVTPDVK
jgi:hypothetical protein